MLKPFNIKSELVHDISTTTVPLPTETKRFEEFSVEKHFVYFNKYNSETQQVEKEPVGSLIWLEGLRQNLEDGVIEFEIIYKYRNEFYRTVVTRDILMEKNLMYLTKIGVDISKSNLGSIKYFLILQEKKVLNMQRIHTKLGWEQQSEELIFYLHENIHSKDVKQPPSIYKGQFELKPKGTFEGWSRVVTEQILGHVRLEFSLVYGFTAVINALLMKHLPLEVLFFHIYGESSKGKTTSARISVSGFGKPSVGGLLENWNATMNALVKNIGNNHGVPVVLDEASVKVNTDYTALIYQIAEGREKRRLNSEIKMNEQATWSGAYISTAEHALTEKSNKNTGISVRAPEFGNKEWTTSAEHASAIKLGMEQNYGTAAPVFVQYIIDHFDKESYIQHFQEAQKHVLEQMSDKDQFSERLAEKYAVILMTAELMNECFDFEVQTNAILQFIVDNDRESIEKRSISKKAFHVITQEILRSQNKFKKTDNEFMGNECYGSMSIKQDYLEVVVLKTILDKWLIDNGFSSPQVAMNELKKQGKLDYESGKNTRKRKLPSEETEALKVATVYVLKMPKDFMESLEPDFNSINNRKQLKPLLKSRPKFTDSNYLEDDEL